MADLVMEIAGRTTTFPVSARVIVGREHDATIRSVNELVSRHHLEFTFEAGRWVALDLGTLNGTYLRGAAVQPNRPVVLTTGMTFNLGDPIKGEQVRILSCGDLAVPAPARPTEGLSLSSQVELLPTQDPQVAGQPAMLGFSTSGRRMSIGRAPDNALVIHDPMVSAHHARLEPREDGGFIVEDLRSTNGTFIDGVRIEREVMAPGSVLSVGRVFLKAVSGRLVRVAQEGSPGEYGQPRTAALQVSGVTFSVPDNRPGRGRKATKTLLDDVSFDIPHRSLVAVIGPSGAGKSTMVKALIGALRPDRGRVLFNGLDVSVFADSLADRMGVVPQEDVVHRELTARQALRYAARLRFPDDSTRAERGAAVDWALDELGLTAHANTRIRQLSGGQRKRVSTAMELLTKPDLLLLDEPTSGLDPSLDREVMELLSELAHGNSESGDGRTIIVITHSTDNLDKADYVLVLAPGGRVAYFGPPQGVRPFFTGRLRGDTSYASIFRLITEHPEESRAAFRQSALADRAAPLPLPPPPHPGYRPSTRRRGLVRQTLTLLGRQARLMAADRSLLVFTLILPVVVGFLTLAVQAEEGFNAAVTTKAVGQPRILLVILVFGAVLMGMVPSVRQLVGERTIYMREAGVGVRPSAYLASKLAMLGVVSAIQSGLLVAVALAVNDHPERGVFAGTAVEFFAVAFSLSWTCSALGLLLSGLVATSEQVMPLMVVVLMFQLVMCGGVLNVSGPGINQVSLAAPSRWGYAAGASTLDLNRTVICNAQILAKAKEDEEVNKKTKEATDEANKKAADNAEKNGLPKPEPEKPKVQHTVVDCSTVDDMDPLWDGTRIRWVGNLFGLGFWLLAYVAGTYIALRRTARP